MRLKTISESIQKESKAKNLLRKNYSNFIDFVFSPLKGTNGDGSIEKLKTPSQLIKEDCSKEVVKE